MKTMGEIIKTRRLELGVTQLELAKKFGFGSAQYISNVERGLSSFSLDQAGKLCQILKLDKNKVRDVYVAESTAKIDRKLKIGAQ